MEQIWAPPRKGEKRRTSIKLDDMYKKWPDRVLRLFRRQATVYSTYLGPTTHTLWQRRA